MKKTVSLLLALACAGALAQDKAACPHASEVTQADLLGLWSAEFAGTGHVGTLLMEKHPLYAESVSGAVNRNGERRRIAGDVDDGDFTLEESVNGRNISATWLGEVVEGSCGREIRGSWQPEGGAPHAFVLRRL